MATNALSEPRLIVPPDTANDGNKKRLWLHSMELVQESFQRMGKAHDNERHNNYIISLHYQKKITQTVPYLASSWEALYRQSYSATRYKNPYKKAIYMLQTCIF